MFEKYFPINWGLSGLFFCLFNLGIVGAQRSIEGQWLQVDYQARVWEFVYTDSLKIFQPSSPKSIFNQTFGILLQDNWLYLLQNHEKTDTFEIIELSEYQLHLVQKSTQTSFRLFKKQILSATEIEPIIRGKVFTVDNEQLEMGSIWFKGDHNFVNWTEDQDCLRSYSSRWQVIDTTFGVIISIPHHGDFWFWKMEDAAIYVYSLQNDKLLIWQRFEISPEVVPDSILYGKWVLLLDEKKFEKSKNSKITTQYIGYPIFEFTENGSFRYDFLLPERDSMRGEWKIGAYGPFPSLSFGRNTDFDRMRIMDYGESFFVTKNFFCPSGWETHPGEVPVSNEFYYFIRID